MLALGRGLLYQIRNPDRGGKGGTTGFLMQGRQAENQRAGRGLCREEDRERCHGGKVARPATRPAGPAPKSGVNWPSAARPLTGGAGGEGGLGFWEVNPPGSQSRHCPGPQKQQV